MLTKEKTEEPQSIAASLLAEIELKLAENAQMGSGDDMDDNHSVRSTTVERSPKNAEVAKKKGGMGFFGSRSNSNSDLKRVGDQRVAE